MIVMDVGSGRQPSPEENVPPGSVSVQPKNIGAGPFSIFGWREGAAGLVEKISIVDNVFCG